MKTLKNELTWSKSRGDVFRQCKRKYYYQYYGSWRGWEPLAEPEARETYVLKQLKNRFLWAGEAVHHDVAHVIQRLTLGEDVPLARTLERARTRMRREFQASRARLYRQSPKQTTGLLEHEYRWPVTAGQWKEIWVHVETCLRGFYASPIFARLKKLPPGAWKAVEHMMRFELDDAAAVFVKLDLAYEAEGELTVVDWKTGRSDEPGSNLFQLACYALFAREEWGFEPGKIWLADANLYTGREAFCRVNAEKLNETAERIRREVRGMTERLSDVAENRADRESFPMTDETNLCRPCAFQKMCYPAGLPSGKREPALRLASGGS